jgi:hypothetical protein
MKSSIASLLFLVLLYGNSLQKSYAEAADMSIWAYSTSVYEYVETNAAQDGSEQVTAFGPLGLVSELNLEAAIFSGLKDSGLSIIDYESFSDACGAPDYDVVQIDLAESFDFNETINAIGAAATDCEIPYLATVKLVMLPPTQRKTGFEVSFSIYAQMVSFKTENPKTILLVGPIEGAAIGESPPVAELQAVRLAANLVLKEIKPKLERWF